MIHLHASDEAAAALIDEAAGEAGGFLLQRAETEAGRALLGEDEAAIFEQEFARLGDCGV